MTEHGFAEPADEDVAAIVAVLLAQRAKPDAPRPEISGWVQAARQDRIDRWRQPMRLSRLTLENINR